MKKIYGPVLHREFVEDDRVELALEMQALRDGLSEDERPMAMQDAFASLWAAPERRNKERHARRRRTGDVTKGESANAMD